MHDHGSVLEAAVRNNGDTIEVEAWDPTKKFRRRYLLPTMNDMTSGTFAGLVISIIVCIDLLLFCLFLNAK